MSRVRVEVEKERVICGEPAKVNIYEDDKLIARVICTIGNQYGADDGLYPCVELTLLNVEPIESEKP
jgi:hypothetical protein